jgi:RNA polymerase sigma-70 factor (ECF subfamily)
MLARPHKSSGAVLGNAACLLDGQSVDRKAVEATLRGDRRAFAIIVAQYQSTVSDQMWRYTRDPLVHEELVHEVFVQAFRGLARFRWRSPLVHWLRRIGVRVGVRSRRIRRRAVPAISLDDWDQHAAQSYSRAGDRASDRLHELLERLSERDRLVLSLLYWQKCSVADAAEIAGWSRTMVRVQAFRARQKLRQGFTVTHD